VVGKGVGSTPSSGAAMSGSMGIKTNPLKAQKNISGEEKKKGRKPYRQNIEETGALIVDLGQVVCLPDNYFPSQPKFGL
jgi:hypothetical protein